MNEPDENTESEIPTMKLALKHFYSDGVQNICQSYVQAIKKNY